MISLRENSRLLSGDLSSDAGMAAMNCVTITTEVPVILNTGFSVFAGVGADDSGSRGTTMRVFR